MYGPRGHGNVPRDVLSRLGNVLYWLGILVGAAPILILLGYWFNEIATNAKSVVDSIFASSLTDIIDKLSNIIVFYASPWMGICYAIGWSLRYILSGHTDHPISKISDKAKMYLSWAIVLPFQIMALALALVWFKKTVGW